MAPNRFADVAAICASHPAAFPQDASNDTARLSLLIGTIIPTLNLFDEGHWGFMTKTDQRVGDGFKVPCDVLMWRPTGDVVDCMTGTGACWIEHAPPPPAWVWTAVKTPEPTPIPPPVPQPEPASIEGIPVLVSPVLVNLVEGTLIVFNSYVSVLLPTGYLSVQPDGRFESRSVIGPWERATRVGPNLLAFEGTGTRYFVAVHVR